MSCRDCNRPTLNAAGYCMSCEIVRVADAVQSFAEWSVRPPRPWWKFWGAR